MEKLKECPFCGEEAELKMECRNNVNWIIWSECKKCKARTVGYYPNLHKDIALQSIENCKEKAIIEWNRRV